MSKPKHTPGPWESIVREEKDGIWAYIGPANERTYHILKMDACNDERQANAALIAAAPELYSLLDQINTAFYTRSTRKQWLELMEKTKPLLQKARGES